MVALYITSTETFSGKSALCVCLARRFQQDGLRIAYMKPVSTGPRLAAGLIDEDAEFVRQAFSLADPLDDMAPIALGMEAIQQVVSGEATADYVGKLESAFRRLAQGRDVVILEGGCNLREGALIGLAPPQVARLLDARTVVVVKHSGELQVLDDALTSQVRLGETLVGVVLNGIPRQHMPFMQEEARPVLERRGIGVLAILPQERLLQSISVGELAQFLDGEILCGDDRTEELVEHLMVGAMGVESALSYFRRKPNKAVITGGDRADIQLAALETSTKCLILTGGLRPSPIILHRAAEVGVPMILVRHDTLAAVETIERFFGKTRFHQEKKIERFEELLADRFDMQRLYAALGLR